MSKIQNDVQTGLDNQEPGSGQGGQGGGQRVDSAGGVFTDHVGQGKWIMEEDPDEFVQGQQPATPPAPASPTPQPGQQPEEFQVTTKTGLVFRGKDANAVLQSALDAIDRQAVNTTQHRAEIANLKRQLEGSGRQIDGQGYSRRGMQIQPAQAPPTPSSSAPSSRPPSPGWDDTAFYNTFAKTPREAMHMAIQDYFGIDDPRSALSTSFDISLQVRDRIEIADFLAQNQDFPQTMEASRMVLDRLDEDGAELTNYNMKVAFDKLVSEGLMARLEGERTTVAEVGGDQPVAQQPPSTRSFVPPPPSRGNGAPPAPGRTAGPTNTESSAPTLEEFESWPWQKQQEFMRKRGMYHG